jgi:phosphatidate cytidylyltransferase
MISRNLAQRLIVAAIFGPLLLYICHYGGLPLFALVELLVVISIWEFFSLVESETMAWQKLLLSIVALYPAYAFKFLPGAYQFELVVALLVIVSFPHAFAWSLGKISHSIGLSFFGFFYLTYGFGSLILIRESGVSPSPDAGDWLVFLFGTVWIVDTAAYFCGRKFGKRKLSPLVSPNKTVVGFIGGLLGAVLSAGIFNFLFLTEVGFLHLVGPALAVALFGQLGDLVESIFKREAGKKDSSNLIPGHGGVLDRFDSILFAAPALYLYLKFIYW